VKWKREGEMDCDIQFVIGNNELVCVRSDKSDKSSWSAGRQSSLGSWFQRQGYAWWKERLLTFREEEEGGRERVMTSEQRVLRWSWTEIMLYSYNYRPISNLSLISKIMECVVKSRLTEHLTSNNLLIPTSLLTFSTTPLKLLCSTFTIILLML